MPERANSSGGASFSVSDVACHIKPRQIPTKHAMRIHLIIFTITSGGFLAPCSSEIKKAADAPQPLSPKESAEHIRLPEGFRIELVASEPVVEEPSCIAWDEQGRVFVCELHGYNIEGHIDTEELNKTGKLDKTVRRVRWEFQGGPIAKAAAKRQTGTLKLLTDTNSDGLMDKATVWADDLPPCYGIVPANGGIIVTCAPHIMFFADRDGDGEPEVRETLFTGFATNTIERGINNPIWGLDGWIYIGSGSGGGTITGPRLKVPFEVGNSDFRIRADGSAIERVNGSVHTFGLTMNDVGDRFPSSGGTSVRYALPLPHRYLARNPHVPSPNDTHNASNYNRGFRISEPHPWRVRRRSDPAWVKFYGDRETNSNYFSGGCSTTYYGGTLFPAQYRGNLFYCEPSLNIIHRAILKRDGAGYKATRAPGEMESEFLASTDQWFRPMNLRTGPDGALYIVDMYREIIEDYSAIPRFLQQQYGLDQGRAHGRIWRLVPKNAEVQESPNFSKLSGIELAQEIGSNNPWRRETAQRLLIERADKNPAEGLAKRLDGNWRGAIRALNTLAHIGALKSSHVLTGLRHKHFGVRIHALRMAEPLLEKDKKVRTHVFSMVDTLDPDPSVRLQIALTLGTLQNEASATRLASLAHRHGSDRWMESAILSSANGQNGSWLSRWKGTLALGTTMAGRRDSNAVMNQLLHLNHLNPETGIPFLQGLITGASQGDRPWPEPTNGWEKIANQLAMMMTSTNAEVRKLASGFAARLPIDSSTYVSKFLNSAKKQALDSQTPLNQRVSAIEMLSIAPYKTLAPIAIKLLDPKQPPSLQLAAIIALGKSHDIRVARELIKAWPSLTPKSRTVVLETLLSQENRLPVLLEAMENRAIQISDLSAIQREKLIQSDHAHRTKKLLAAFSSDADLPKRIARYQKALTVNRDGSNGKSIYAKNCLMCHKLDNEGNEIGPSLASISGKPDEGILMDILDPNGKIDPEYKLYLVTTSTGGSHAGVLANESATSLTLKRPDGKTDIILRKDIKTMTTSEVSLMPANLHEQITPAEMASLVTFLRTKFGKR